MAGTAQTLRKLAAFSLIEMLTVITIIVILFALLLPSLKNGKEQARTVVCESHLAGIGRAAAGYSAEAHGWLCGSPGTSGSLMYREPSPPPASEDFDTDATQIWDYAGPLAAKHFRMKLPANRAERFAALLDGVFRCPSNAFQADPFPKAAGSFTRLPLVSYNTFRNFLMWTRTLVDFNPNRPWGVRPPVPEAGFDNIGGRTLPPKNHKPNLDLIANPSGKAYLADGNRFTTASGLTTYDLEWDALDGGAFCNGGPTLREYDGPQFVLSAYHFSRRLGRFGYRHRANGEWGIVVNYLDGHCDRLSESESRQPDTWWPKGTIIPFQDLNDPTRFLVAHRLNAQGSYVVGR